MIKHFLKLIINSKYRQASKDANFYGKLLVSSKAIEKGRS